MRKQILALLSTLGLVGPAAPASAQNPKDGTSNTIKAESTVKRAKATHESKAATLGRDEKFDKSSPTLQNQKWSKNNAESTAARTAAAHKQAQASGKRAVNGQTTSVIPPGPNVLKTSKIPPGPNSMNLKAGRADFGKFQTGPAKTLTLNPQPLPPGVHTVNPQPTPPGIHPTLNPQPLPPGIHTLNPQPLPPGVHTDVGGKGLSARKKLTVNPQPLPPGAHTLNPQPLPPGVHTSNARMTSSPNKTAIGSGTSGAGAGKDTNKASKSAPKPR